MEFFCLWEGLSIELTGNDLVCQRDAPVVIGARKCAQGRRRDGGAVRAVGLGSMTVGFRRKRHFVLGNVSQGGIGDEM